MLSTIRHFAETNPAIGNGSPERARYRLQNMIANPDSRRALIEGGALLRIGGRWLLHSDRMIAVMQDLARQTVEEG